MSDTEVASSRPWTAGPWKAAPLLSERPHGMARRTAHFDVTDTAYRPHDVSSIDADAELIALAPEMAEAILAKYAPCAGDGSENEKALCDDRDATWWEACDFHENAPKMYDIEVKLRAIGGAS